MGDLSVNRRAKAETIIWHKRLTKSENLACILKCAWIPLVLLAVLGLILTLTGVTGWGGFYFFFGLSEVIFIIILIAGSVQKPAEYTATTAGIICKYQNAVYSAEYGEIESVKFTRGLFKKSKGKIKFKLKRGLSLNYRFYEVDSVEAVYNLILTAMKTRADELSDGLSNKM